MTVTVTCRSFTSLEIPILDERVEVTPMPVDRLEDAEQFVRTRLDEVAPALLATAAADYGTRRDEIAQGLRALQLMCTSELGLKYVLKGHAPRQTIGASAVIHEGTAYMAVDEGEPDWSAFGLRLADYLDVPLGDAFALLLDASPRGRQNYLHARHISDEAVQGAEEVLSAEAESVDLHDHSRWDYASAPESDSDPSHEGLAEVREDTAVAGVEADAHDVSISAVNGQGHEQEREISGQAGRAGDAERSPGPVASPDEEREASQSSKHPRGKSTPSSAASGTASVSREIDGDEPDSQAISRFYSYVAAAGSREARMAERQDTRAIKLGEHGVERVVEYEAARGRMAQPQPHNNKGFDVISCRPDGSDRRIIEVKATARDWPDRGVPVSDSQIDKNRELGDEFWLYVVEHPEDPEQARVTAIQNPVASADYFAFDPGWRALGEPQS